MLFALTGAYRLITAQLPHTNTDIDLVVCLYVFFVVFFLFFLQYGNTYCIDSTTSTLEYMLQLKPFLKIVFWQT